MRVRTAQRMVAIVGALALTIPLLAATTTAQDAESARLVENAPTDGHGVEPFLRAEDASIRRFDDHLEFEVTMRTPEPGSYTYPDVVPIHRQAPPEVFTAWVFVFNHSEHCSVASFPTCNADDFSEAVKSGVYGIAGHVSSVDHEGGAFILDRATDGTMTFRGAIAVGQPQDPRLPPGTDTYPLENPMGAEVHVAIAPHGQLDPSSIATELYAPQGDPGCGCWWVAFFGAPDV